MAVGVSESNGAESAVRVPGREVHHAEALAWLAEHPAQEGTSVVTSLPDLSEVPALGFEGWRAWFLDAAERVMAWLPADGLAIFYQSDVRRKGSWVDKGYLIARAAEAAGADMVWHKVVCRKPPGTITHGRAGYAHLLCFSREARPVPRHWGPDVIVEAALLPWSKAMGVAACRAACRFLLEESQTRRVVDPFCGRGTALAVANEFGFDAVGIDLGTRACRHARKLVLPEPGASEPSGVTGADSSACPGRALL
jgi:hypothetical protein